MKNDTINRLYNLIKKFEKEKGSITTAVLFNSYDNYYRLMFASECLNSVGPYDATLEIVKYMKANDKDILKDLYFTITTVHTEDIKMGFRDSDNTALRFHSGTDGGNTYLSRHCFSPENFKTVVAKFDLYIDNYGAYYSATLGTGHKGKYNAFQYLIDARNRKYADVYSTPGAGGGKMFTLNLNEWYQFEIRYTVHENQKNDYYTYNACLQFLECLFL